MSLGLQFLEFQGIYKIFVLHFERVLRVFWGFLSTTSKVFYCIKFTALQS